MSARHRLPAGAKRLGRTAAAVGGVAALCATTLTVTTTPALAAATLKVAPGAGPCGSAGDSTCGTIQLAVDAARALESPGHVRIKVPKGTFAETGPSGGLTIAGATAANPLTRLTIDGRGDEQTIIRPGAPNAPVVLLNEADFPVTFDDVRLTGATGRLSTSGLPPLIGLGDAAIGLVANESDPVRLIDSQISGIRGANGDATVAAGSAIGLLDLASGVRMIDSEIRANHGGDATSGAQPSGGIAVGALSALAEFSMRNSDVSDNVAGRALAGEPNTAGGATAAIGVASLLGGLEVIRSTVADNTAGAAGRGADDPDPGDPGEDGGVSLSVGVLALNGVPLPAFGGAGTPFGTTRIVKSTVGGHRAGPGGAGGAATGASGDGGFGGLSAAIGVLNLGLFAMETSTVADTDSANGGRGGRAASLADDAGADGASLGFGVLSLDAVGLSLGAQTGSGRDSRMSHSTITDVTAGDGPNSAAVGVTDLVTAVGGGGFGGFAADSQAESGPGPDGDGRYSTRSHEDPNLAEIPTSTEELLAEILPYLTDANAKAGGASLEGNGGQQGAAEPDSTQAGSQGGAAPAGTPAWQNSSIAAEGAGASSDGPVLQLDRNIINTNDNNAHFEFACFEGFGLIGDDGYNVDNDSTCTDPGTGSFTEAKLGKDLGKLRFNGAETRTVRLDADSDAAEAVPDKKARCDDEDQRGVERPGAEQGESCAAGSFEPGQCHGRDLTIVGTDGRDRIKGTNGRDVIHGLDGKDRIKARGGKDVVCGGDGRDRISGGKGKDKLYGQDGRDRLNGGKGKDREVAGG